MVSGIEREDEMLEKDIARFKGFYKLAFENNVPEGAKVEIEHIEQHTAQSPRWRARAVAITTTPLG